jgi:hypothetical protein
MAHHGGAHKCRNMQTGAMCLTLASGLYGRCARHFCVEMYPLEGVRPSGPFLYLHKLIDEQTLRETMARVASPLPPTLR